MKQLLDLLTWEPNLRMQYELLLMLLLFLVPAAFIKNTKRLLITWGTIFTVFLLLHGSFFPFVLAGAYCCVLCGLWTAVREGSFRVFCAPWDMMRRGMKELLPGFPGAVPSGNGEEKGRGNRYLLAVILIVLLVQLNRIDIAADYDSLRYGLRSPYVLLGGKGITGFFENLGLVNTVYTYSKGFELLTLPLSLFSVYISASKSYAYVLCFNVWVLIGIFLLCGKLAKRLTGRMEAGLAAAFFCALIPGVTNMALTAKSDLLTLFCQLYFLMAAMEFICSRAGKDERERAGWVSEGLAALIISYALKPTSMLFSSVLGLCILLCLLYGVKQGRRKLLPGLSPSGLRLPGLALIFTGLCWGRTWLLTGLPVTSVFSGILTALGFSMKYPFAAQAAPGTEAGAMPEEQLKLFIGRLWRLLFCPSGSDMEHVRMAWGGIAFVLLLVLIFVYGWRAYKNLKEQAGLCSVKKTEALPETACTEERLFAVFCFGFIFFSVTALSLVSLALLYQVDGNYYMLWYALSAVLGTVVFYALAWTESSAGTALSRVLSLLAASMLYITAFTGWAGAVGFTPSGFQQDRITREAHTQEGDYALWRLLGETGKGAENHVIAFSSEPECYDLRCIVESYTDIAGSGGNVYLVKTLNIFKEYLSFADVDYIYADKEWLALPGNERASQLLYDLVEDGTFTEILYDADAEKLLEAENSAFAAKDGETRYFIAAIDKERVKLNWETPMTEAQKVAAEAALQKLGFAD